LSTTQDTFTLTPVSTAYEASLDTEVESPSLLPSTLHRAPRETDPEEDLMLMARSMPSTALENQHRPTGEASDGGHFLSERDKQYIKTLVVLGYGQDAARLLRRAYEKRRREIDDLGAGGGHLFTPFQIEYLEMLLVVGDRRTAISTVLSCMDEYQIRETRQGTVNLRSSLDREYERTITAIEKNGHLPPADDSQPSSSRRLHDLLRRIFHRT